MNDSLIGYFCPAPEMIAHPRTNPYIFFEEALPEEGSR